MDPAVQDAEPPVPKTLLLPSDRRSERVDLDGTPASAEVPVDRPSERPTRPTLPPCEDPSDEDLGAVIELSASELVDVDSSVDTSSISDSSGGAANASTFRPPPHRANAARVARRSNRSWLGPALRIAAASLLFVGAVFVLLDGPADPSFPRAPRVEWPERTTMAGALVGAPTPAPPAHACIATDAPRFVAPRALINAGLDVSSSATGFVVSLAASNDEASAVRLEGTTLRLAENIRVRPNAPSPIRRVVARETGADGTSNEDFIDVRADADDARTILPEGESAAYRIGVAGAFVVVRANDRLRSLWSLPLPPKDRRIDALRVAPRDDGGAAVVVKRGSTFHLGLLNGMHAATGPLLTITRGAATVGTPYVIANGGGAALTWAERANGARDWTIMVASLGGGEMETKAIGSGMSPSLAALPDGTLVVAYADGPAASHRIVVRRLAADLSPASVPVVASPENVNAGQPVVEVRPDGRALVAWLAVARGQPASVYATPLQCDVTSASASAR